MTVSQNYTFVAISFTIMFFNEISLQDVSDPGSSQITFLLSVKNRGVVFRCFLYVNELKFVFLLYEMLLCKASEFSPLFNFPWIKETDDKG